MNDRREAIWDTSNELVGSAVDDALREAENLSPFRLLEVLDRAPRDIRVCLAQEIASRGAADALKALAGDGFRCIARDVLVPSPAADFDIWNHIRQSRRYAGKGFLEHVAGPAGGEAVPGSMRFSAYEIVSAGLAYRHVKERFAMESRACARLSALQAAWTAAYLTSLQEQGGKGILATSKNTVSVIGFTAHGGTLHAVSAGYNTCTRDGVPIWDYYCTKPAGGLAPGTRVLVPCAMDEDGS